MPREDRATWKSNFFLGIIQLLDDYPKCFIVGAGNVGSKQVQQIRMSLRGKAVVLMGKNTMMRKAIRGHLENNPALEKLLPHIRGMWALCSPRRTSLRSGTCCWPIRCQLLPVLVPLPPVKPLCQPRTLVWGQRRPPSSRL
ncbi:60S acidic ribosomal protein P0 [Myotis brandtii]|uniref:Large ribosomal subunit protein uL10 n=1 Tax=Myotis brandtii TaxID=109478 RepID=S7Q2H0_MYOBR|nr:60S acidic ribosomal protein P0 [Myotis brandtii]